MTRLSGKIVITPSVPVGVSINSDFYKPDVDATVRDKGINVIFQKAYLCPCKSKESDHRNVCDNCGGTGWLFANPTKTQMIISAIKSDKKFEEWGIEDMGMVNVTALNDQKFGLMDMIVVLDATAEHSQIVYPKLTDDDTKLFAFTKYDIVGIDYVALFVDPDQELKRLTEDAGDFTFRDNVIIFDPKYNDTIDPCVTIRYIHHPVFHIMGVSRESFTSTQGSLNQGRSKLILPIHAIAKRAHLVKDVENFDGDRLLDNSWLPLTCEEPEIAMFIRQLKYTSVSDIYNALTENQKVELNLLLQDSDDAMGVDGGILEINP